MGAARIVMRVIAALAALAIVLLQSAVQVGFLGGNPTLQFLALVAVGLFVFVESIAAIIQGARRAKGLQNNSRIEKVLLRALVALSEATTVPLTDMGASAFSVRRRRWFYFRKGLVRVVRFRPTDDLQSTKVKWSRGKGAVGNAWKTGHWKYLELIELWEEWSETDGSHAAFVALGQRSMGFTFEEFTVLIDKYAETLAMPVMSANGDSVIGVLSIDVRLKPEDGMLLEALNNDASRRVLEAAAIAVRDVIDKSYPLR